VARSGDAVDAYWVTLAFVLGGLCLIVLGLLWYLQP
jgi:hypothetical protein